MRVECELRTLETPREARGRSAPDALPLDQRKAGATPHFIRMRGGAPDFAGARKP
jgi:hypothetical protein